MAELLPDDADTREEKSRGVEYADEKAHVNAAMQSVVFTPEGAIDDTNLNSLILDGEFDYAALLENDDPQNAKPDNPGGGKGGDDDGGSGGGGKGGGKNKAPDAQDDTATIAPGEDVTIDVLANDTDRNGDTLTITDFTSVSNGTLIDNGDGTFKYTPDDGFEGTDTFTYTISDGNGGTDTANVTITVETPTPYYIDALHSGYEWAKTLLTYQFVDHLPSYYSNFDDEANNFQAFNQTMMDAAYSIFDMVETFVNLEFLEATDNYGDITLATANLGQGVGAWAYYPYTQTENTKAGDIWINNLYADGLNPIEGSWGYFVIIHELGHSLGLKHSFDEPALPAAEDNHQYSVMSYTYDDNGNYSESFALYDIAALQDLYGANTTYNAGDTIYDLTDYYDSNQAIWDAGGTDTLDGSSETTDLIIDLNEGAFSSIGSSENFAIAYDVEIENATGGSGNDTLIGNELANILSGGAGDDTLYYDGLDVLDGGTDNDTLVAMYESIIDVGSGLLSGFENFDLTNSLSDVVDIVLSDILDLSDNDDLFIIGDDAVDTINITGGAYDSDVDISGTTYAYYTDGAADLYVESTLVINETGIV